MNIYRNITTAGSATTLIIKDSNVGGNVSKITISNNSDNPATIIVDLFDGASTVFYICKNIVIPKGAVLVLEDNVQFDSAKYNLRIYNTGTGPDLTVIIK